LLGSVFGRDKNMKGRILSVVRFGRRHWRCLVATVAHYVATGACLFIVLLEWMDRATDEDKVAISHSVLAGASIGAKILMFPIGYAVHWNGSMAIVVLLLNSAIVGFSPVWIKAIYRRLTSRTESKAEHGRRRS
jgi:hypothetical protein